MNIENNLSILEILRSSWGQQHVRSLSLAEKVAKKTARHNSRDDGLASREGVGRERGGDYDLIL